MGVFDPGFIAFLLSIILWGLVESSVERALRVSIGRWATLALGIAAFGFWVIMGFVSPEDLFFQSTETAWVSVLGAPSLVFGLSIIVGGARRWWLRQPAADVGRSERRGTR